MNARAKKRIPVSELSYEYLDVALDVEHPVAWTVNEYSRATQPHYDIHIGLEIGIVLEGRSRRWYRDHSFLADPGQVWLAGLWEPHGLEILQPGTRHLVFGVLPEFLGISDPFFGDDWMRLFRLPPPLRPRAENIHERKKVLEIAHRLIAAMNQSGRFSLAKVRLLLQELLLMFLERKPPARETLPAGGARTKPCDILPALRFIEDRVKSNFTVAAAAREAHMSRSRFSEEFHRQMGMTFGQYVRGRRIAGVMQDLRTKDDKLMTIALNWGFSDASHLIRTFQKLMNLSPQQYRARARESSGKAVLTSVVMPRPGGILS